MEKSLTNLIRFQKRSEHGVVTSKIADESAGSHQFSIENIFHMDDSVVQEGIFEDLAA